MPTLDSLPGDQRAVLQLVLGKGRGYAEIARMLSLDPGAVRARALAATHALAPPTTAPPERTELIADYLLGQLDPAGTERARSLLAGSPGDRAWARLLSTSLAPLASGAMPEIPAAPAAAVEAPAASGETPPPVAAPPVEPPSWEAAQAPPPPQPPPPQPPPPQPQPPPEAPAAEAPPTQAPAKGRRRDGGERSGDGPRTSRIGGAILIGVALAVVLILLFRNHSTNKSTPPASSSTPAARASTSTTLSSTSTSASSSTTSSSTTATKVLAQINLTPPASSHSKAAGIAEILKEGTTDGLAIVAQNVPPNTTRPPNAYAVWLYNSPTDAQILGFVNPGVGKSGRFSTATTLHGNPARYHQIIVTLETSATPKTPGRIILQGTITGL